MSQTDDVLRESRANRDPTATRHLYAAPAPRHPGAEPHPEASADGPLLAEFRWDVASETVSWSPLDGWPDQRDRPSSQDGDGDPEARCRQVEVAALGQQVMEACRRADRPVSRHQTITDPSGRGDSTVLAVVTPVRGVDSDEDTYSGVVVDLSDLLRRARNESVLAARHGNAAIQQATGILVVLLGLSEEASIALLRRVSSQRNVKMALLAERFVLAVREATLRGQTVGAAMLTELLDVASAATPAGPQSAGGERE